MLFRNALESIPSEIAQLKSLKVSMDTACIALTTHPLTRARLQSFGVVARFVYSEPPNSLSLLP
jgi:hypothetical protein